MLHRRDYEAVSGQVPEVGPAGTASPRYKSCGRARNRRCSPGRRPKAYHVEHGHSLEAQVSRPRRRGREAGRRFFWAVCQAVPALLSLRGTASKDDPGAHDSRERSRSHRASRRSCRTRRRADEQWSSLLLHQATQGSPKLASSWNSRRASAWQACSRSLRLSSAISSVAWMVRNFSRSATRCANSCGDRPRRIGWPPSVLRLARSPHESPPHPRMGFEPACYATGEIGLSIRKGAWERSLARRSRTSGKCSYGGIATCPMRGRTGNGSDTEPATRHARRPFRLRRCRPPRADVSQSRLALDRAHLAPPGLLRNGRKPLPAAACRVCRATSLSASSADDFHAGWYRVCLRSRSIATRLKCSRGARRLSTDGDGAMTGDA